MNLFILYVEFVKIGFFAIGGGLATLPFLYRLADNYEWLSVEKIADFLAIAQSSPGAIGVNVAVQAGFQCAGAAGAVLAALGLISPSIIVIIIVARMFQAFKENKAVGAVFSGLRPAAGGLLAAAGFGVWKLSLYNGSAPVWYEMLRLRECIIFGVLFLGILKFKGHPIIYIGAGAAAGIILGL